MYFNGTVLLNKMLFDNSQEIAVNIDIWCSCMKGCEIHYVVMFYILN